MTPKINVIDDARRLFQDIQYHEMFEILFKNNGKNNIL